VLGVEAVLAVEAVVAAAALLDVAGVVAVVVLVVELLLPLPPQPAISAPHTSAPASGGNRLEIIGPPLIEKTPASGLQPSRAPVEAQG
jgi:hypothetical protein